MCRLLYYPYISLPNAAWLTQALLYWDGISTIVPTDYLEYPNQFSSFARGLVRENIIQTVQPEEYVDSYYDEFMTFLEWSKAHSSHFLLEKTANKATTQFYLHAGKLGVKMRREFIHLGFARRVNSRWCEVNRQFSMSFMTFLAVLIGQKDNYVPMTDSYQGMSTLFDVGIQAPSKNKRRIRNTLRNSILDDIFPVPYNVNDLSDILRFKERYQDELQRFRRYIEDFIISLDGLSEEVQIRRCQNFRVDIHDSLDEIKGHMGWFRAPKINFGTLVSILPCVYEAMNKNPTGTAVSLAAVLGQMSWNDEKDKNLRKPLAYAALYRDRFHGW